ncbi:hypothetical protein [Cellulomonas sp. NPDC058312]|uniref:hypothetical protein n=1 Tax=Cellulomonas sp. NPDC058312 TaxID=3346441 RepID=UPI0036E06346
MVTAMSESDDGPSPRSWDAPDQVVPVQMVIPQYAELEIDRWSPVILVQDGRRLAIIVGWDWWTVQQERYLHAAAVGWAHWRGGKFDAQGFGWRVMPFLSSPQDPPVHPEPPPPSAHVDDDSDDDVRPG